jgi:hypothetical protein
MASKYEEDAYDLIKNTLDSWGLRELNVDIRRFLEQGWSEDRVFIELQETDAWKKRFAGNEMRKKNGLAVLSPAEYLAVEASYRQIMESAGLPKGFYDKPDDFAKWIGSNVAPTEVKNRVDAAVNFVSQAPKEAFEIMRRQGFTDGELYAFALDQKRTERLVVERFRSAELRGRFESAGQAINRGTADRIAAVAGENAVNRDAVQAGARLADQGSRLASIYGERYDANMAARDVFLQDVQAGNTRRRLASQERGQFSGSGGIGEQSLNRRTRT